MAIYCIDDGGDGTQTNSTQTAGTLDWSKADTSVANLIAYDAAAFTTAGNVIYFGDDHNDPDKAANTLLTLASGSAPVFLISADRTQATPTYKVGTGNQLSSLGGTYSFRVLSAGVLHGIRIASGGNATLEVADSAYPLSLKNCTIALGAGSTLTISPASGKISCNNFTIDLTADGTTNRGGGVITWGASGAVSLNGLDFVNAGYRTGNVINPNYNLAALTVADADFSGFTNATLCEVFNAATNVASSVLTNCKTAGTWGVVAASGVYGAHSTYLCNVGPSHSPTSLISYEPRGGTVSSSAIYRTGGATVESVSTSWLITTLSACSESTPYRTPCIYGTIASTGSKTFDLYITNDTADLTDAECWLEVEYLADSGSGKWTLVSDQRATITAAAAAQTDDTTSTWNGTGPSFTYKQKLSVTATVNETGMFRARVCVGLASIASSRYFYVDPKVTVS